MSATGAGHGRAGGGRCRGGLPSRRPRLGILDDHPIQYHAPLYRRLSQRGRVELEVLFLTDQGCTVGLDPAFGVRLAWDIDLLSGYEHRFLAGRWPAVVRDLSRWITDHDAVVVHGYSRPLMLLAIALCRLHRVPCLLRGDSLPRGRATGLRRRLRDVVAGTVVAASWGGLAMGTLNAGFYRRYRARRVFFAPACVDDERFAAPPPVGRAELLARWGQPDDRPVVIFCGKLVARKRPLDLVTAARLAGLETTLMFVGDGALADQVRAAIEPRLGVVTGFVNQRELPSYYHAADVLVLPSEAEPWGLVVNEAMAAGVLPVASDRVGAAADLVAGVGEVYPCGDVAGLAAALRLAVTRAGRPGARELARRHAARYSLDQAAAGFEDATLAIADRAGGPEPSQGEQQDAQGDERVLE